MLTLRWLSGRSRGLGSGPAAPVGAAVLHLLAKLFALLGREGSYFTGYLLFPLAAFLGPAAAASAKAAEQNAAQHEQPERLTKADERAVEKAWYQPVPKILGDEYGHGHKEGREEDEFDGFLKPKSTVHIGSAKPGSAIM
jgi:hypothetical protein